MFYWDCVEGDGAVREDTRLSSRPGRFQTDIKKKPGDSLICVLETPVTVCDTEVFFFLVCVTQCDGCFAQLVPGSVTSLCQSSIKSLVFLIEDLIERLRDRSEEPGPVGEESLL